MSASAYPGMQVTTQGDATIVRFDDGKALDEQNSAVVGEQLARVVDTLSVRKLILDFTHVRYLSSAGLGIFIVLHKKLRELGGTLQLIHLDPQIYEVFEITKLNKLLSIQQELKK